MKLKKNMNIILLIIIGLNALISYKGFNDSHFFDKFKFNIGAIKNGEQYRNITSGFLHANMQHLLFNMVGLYFFAPIIISTLGQSVFLIIYLFSLLLGSALSYYFHKNNNRYSAIGASGAVTGVIYAAIILMPDMIINFIIPGWLFGIGYLVYSIVGMKKQIGNIGHAAHFGGAIAGYAIAITLGSEIALSNRMINLLRMVDFAIEQQTVTLLIGIPIIVLFILIQTDKL